MKDYSIIIEVYVYNCDGEDSMVKKMEEKQILTINDCCENRIKPQLIRDVKTEAILVFARTALERYFTRFEQDSSNLSLFNEDDTSYVNNALRELLNDLQKYVVNVEFLVDLVRDAKKNPSNLSLQKLAKYEEPLITYYDSMAKRIAFLFPSKTEAVPELLVISMLSIWFSEEEKSSDLYPFIKKYDTLQLIEKFEIYGQSVNEKEKKIISSMQTLSIDVIEVLINTKYKFNQERKSKNRQNKSKRRR